MINKNKGNKKNIFLFFGPDKDYSLLLRISIDNGESGSRSSLWKNILKTICSKCWYNSLIFENFVFFSNIIEKRRY